MKVGVAYAYWGIWRSAGNIFSSKYFQFSNKVVSLKTIIPVSYAPKNKAILNYCIAT